MRSLHDNSSNTAIGGFTLVELLVVITLIVILISLLAPALDSALASAELARCAAQQHALIQTFTTYAVDNRRKWPSGKRDPEYADYEHAIFVSTAFIEMVEEYHGNNKPRPEFWGGVPPLLTDPAFKDFGWWQRGPNVGWGIGYMYLGGHPFLSAANKPTAERPEQKSWDSPISLASRGSGQLVVCHLTWSLTPGLVTGVDASSWVVVAHTRGGGAYGDWNDPTNRHMNYNQFKTADDSSIGAIGSNIGYIDGSSHWKDIGDMDEYFTAATEGGAGAGYPGLW